MNDAPAPPPGPGPASLYDRHWRWFVLAALFLATFLCYFDRQMLGTAIKPIAEECGLDNADRGDLLSAFMFSYAACLFVVGFVADRVNPRWFFPVMLLGWSLSTIAVGFSRTAEQIYWLRVLLGVWESVNFPLCILIVGRLFPPEERSLASGIFASGAFLATLAAPPFVVLVTRFADWRDAFLAAGTLGVGWVALWLLVFRDPAGRSERWARAVAARDAGPGRTSWWTDLGRVLSRPGFWGVALMGLGIVPSLYFATQWFPSVLEQQFGVDFERDLSWRLSAIYLMQDVGLILGGWAVMALARGGRTVLGSRKLVVTAAGLLMLCVVAAPALPSANAATALFAVYVFGIGAFLGNQHAFKQDVDPGRIATVSALVGGIETGFAALVVQRVGLVTNDSADFTPVFYALAGLAAFGVVVTLAFVRPKWFRVE